MKIRIPYLIFGLLATLLTSTAVMFMIFASQVPVAEPLPHLGTVQPFTLTTSQNQTLDLAHLNGKIWVADFIFTTCAGPCPLMSREMARLQRMFKGTPEVSLVSFSVDPETDTPAVLSTYANFLGADLNRWHFLTGDYDDIQSIAIDSFHLGSVDNPIHHSTYFSLVDRTGAIRGYFDSVDRTALEELTHAIQKLLSES